MGTDGPAKRRQIEDSTAARLAEIVASAERAAKQVIDEAEEEARTRLSDAHEEAERIVAARLAGLADLTDEINAQAEALVRQAEALQGALARAKAEIGGSDAPGGSARIGRPESEPEPLAARKPSSPSLTVVGGAPEAPAADARVPRGLPSMEPAAGRERVPAVGDDPEPYAPEPVAEAAPDLAGAESVGSTPAGARLLATQMAVSGSSRTEIEARLRNGFAIADTQAILDAILGPEH